MSTGAPSLINVVQSTAVEKTPKQKEPLPILTKMPQAASGGLTDEDLSESVDALRQRLDAMKRLMAQNEKAQNRAEIGGIILGSNDSKKNADSIIDGNFLGVVFGVVLVLIISVSIYAFYNLYYAVLKKFPSRPHTEL